MVNQVLGKSTLLSLLAGLDVPTKGEVQFKGEDIVNNGYSYNKSYEKVLKNINMDFEEGKFYAIIGKSGSR